MDLCFWHANDFDTNLVGSWTQMNVSYASAFLMPCWQLMTLYLYAGLVAQVNDVNCSSVDDFEVFG